MPDGGPHGGHEPVEPDLDLSLAEAVHVELDVLAVLSHQVTFEFGGLLLPVRTLRSFLLMTLRHPVSTKGPTSQLKKGPWLAKDDK